MTTIFHHMDGEVDLRARLLLLDGADRIVNLHALAVIIRAGRAFGAVVVHPVRLVSRRARWRHSRKQSGGGGGEVGARMRGAQ